MPMAPGQSRLHILLAACCLGDRPPIFDGRTYAGFAREGFCFLNISAVPSSAMKRSLVFHICGMLCCILLLSPNATCLALQRLHKRSIPEANGAFDGTFNTDANDGLPPTPSTFEKYISDTSPYMTASNKELGVPQESQNNLNPQNSSMVVEKSPEVDNVGFIEVDAIGQGKTSDENGVLTTAGSTVGFVQSVAPVIETKNQDAEESFTQTEDIKTDLNQNNLENSSQVNTIEMLTTNPRTSIVETETDYSTVSSQLAAQLLTTVNAEFPGDLDPTMIVIKSIDDGELVVPQLGEDWDDTKVTTQSPKNLGRSELTTAGPIEEEHPESAMFSTSPGITVMSDDKSVFNVTENTLVTDGRVSPKVTNSLELNPELRVTMLTPQRNIEVNQSQDLSAANTGDKQLTANPTEISNATVTAAIFVNATSQDPSGEPEVREDGADSSTLHVEVLQNETNGFIHLSKEDEEFLASSISPVTPMATTEVESTTIISTVTSVPRVSVDIPPTRRIASTASDGLDRLESEEGDEEDEDEEDEDDDETDEDDEEDEEDNKDNDSESSEKDSDVPLFTLPGLSSQEPLEDDGNVALIEGAAYPVPDTMEWEQQNQGLVCSIMNKAQCSVVVAALLAEEARRRDEAQILERRSKRKRRMWTIEWLQRRSELSHMQLVRELQDKNPHDFQNYLRMSEESFIYWS
ncbi:armadillo-like helical domain-containing protein 4 isoform X2 [Dendrobates tinctorius]|uniref:armadillo-like helical domain-containing protein 4 isoform X2 n=1 Tax=Dendrobates tinctorius TaxID=92724 RepID=UPI003CCA5E3F